jgi:hypothetical protein
VAVVPYAVASLLLAPIALGYCMALARYRRGEPADLEAGERLIKTLTCALIAILTLSRPEFPAAEAKPSRRPAKARPFSGAALPAEAGGRGGRPKLSKQLELPQEGAGTTGRVLADSKSHDAGDSVSEADGLPNGLGTPR